MIFTTAQLEIIATLSHARAPAAQICEALGISEAEFAAWHQRLAMGRSYVEPVSIPSKPVRQLPERLRFRAEKSSRMPPRRHSRGPMLRKSRRRCGGIRASRVKP